MRSFMVSFLIVQFKTETTSFTRKIISRAYASFFLFFPSQFSFMGPKPKAKSFHYKKEEDISILIDFFCYCMISRNFMNS